MAEPAEVRVACLSEAADNPYLELLYGALRPLGVVLVPDPRFTFGWLVRHRRRVGVLHFHWPEGLYRHQGEGQLLHPALSWLKLGLFALRLTAARLLGYRLVWTIHQLYPHRRESGVRERLGVVLLGWACQALIAHDEATAAAAHAELPGRPHVEVIPHGSYVGVYPPGRSREEVRAELGLGPEAFVFLCFGELRANKGLELALAAFRTAGFADAALVVAGRPKDGAAAAPVAAAAAADTRVKALLDFVPQERVAGLYGACDAAIVSRSDGGTSGSLVLALSLGLPVIVSAKPAYAELVGRDDAGWLFAPGDVDSLRGALEAAASDRNAAARKGRAARERAERLRWPEVADRTAALMGSTSRPPAASGLEARRPEELVPLDEGA
jgi:beta-1,4-mannosyltransferase